jgi:hypothetical protein
VDTVSHKVYWTTGFGEISRANYDGTSPQTLVPPGTLGTDASAGIDLDLSAGKMYLSYANLNKITRRNLDGSDPETVLTLDPQEGPVGMELFAGRMYWCSEDGSLRSATINGADVKTILSGLDSPRAVSVLNVPEPTLSCTTLLLIAATRGRKRVFHLPLRNGE